MPTYLYKAGTARISVYWVGRENRGSDKLKLPRIRAVNDRVSISIQALTREGAFIKMEEINRGMGKRGL